MNRYRALGPRHLDTLARRAGIDEPDRAAMAAVAAVLPFRTSEYVTEHLIDWDAAPDDPIFRLVFPAPDMLPAADVKHLTTLAGTPALPAAVAEVRAKLNPHPASQLTLNVPTGDDGPLPGIQHKYPQTVLVFPSQGQTCHAYCTYCFRWAQFTGDPATKIATSDPAQTAAYIAAHTEVSSVLLTGGDPAMMSTAILSRYIEPLLRLDHVATIRIGTKALSYWPYRFTTDPDAPALLKLLSDIRATGRSVAIMAHFSHPRELEPQPAADAAEALTGAGAVIRTQAPLIRTINDDPATWETMWARQVRMGMVPYYMFVERDTGPQDYFAVPLADCYRIYRDAWAALPGLARTVRGPSMSAGPGKICIDGIATIGGAPFFVLHMIQARDQRLTGRPFFAHYDRHATWLSDLLPAFAPFPWY